MTDFVPVLLASKGVVITQFDLDSVSHIGLVKIDLLGIRGLTVLGDVAEELQNRNPDEYRSPLDALDAIPDQDPATAELLKAGHTIGCFQIESPGMRATLKEIQAGSMDDLMIALALYRPGPLTGGLKDAFVRRHRGEEEITHLHPALSEILADTYGVILYQEQVLRIAHLLAGLSLADADAQNKIYRRCRRAKPDSSGYRGTCLGVDGCLCRLWIPQSPRSILCTDRLAGGLEQDSLPRVFHGIRACQLGRLLSAASLPE
jgi:DNA polymerase III alpha subunit